MRYVMRIAEFSESSTLRTHLAQRLVFGLAYWAQLSAANKYSYSQRPSDQQWFVVALCLSSLPPKVTIDSDKEVLWRCLSVIALRSGQRRFKNQFIDIFILIGSIIERLIPPYFPGPFYRPLSLAGNST